MTLAAINPDVQLEPYTMNITTVQGFEAFKDTLVDKGTGEIAAAVHAVGLVARWLDAGAAVAQRARLPLPRSENGWRPAAEGRPGARSAEGSLLLLVLRRRQVARGPGAQLRGQLRGAHHHQPGAYARGLGLGLGLGHMAYGHWPAAAWLAAGSRRRLECRGRRELRPLAAAARAEGGTAWLRVCVELYIWGGHLW